MIPEPALKNLTPEEHSELERLRTRQTEMLTATDPRIAAVRKDELRRVQARIRALTEKGESH